jgi:hypothetical protein
MKICGWNVRQEYKSRFSLFSDVRTAVEKSEVLLGLRNLVSTMPFAQSYPVIELYQNEPILSRYF